MPDNLPLLIIVGADLFVFVLVGYYFFNLRWREKRVASKENAIDANYHHVVDEALSKERQILDDAIHEADQIVTGAQYLTSDSKQAVNQALKSMVTDIHKEAIDTARTFTGEYTTTLKQLMAQSMTDFQAITKSLETDLQKQIQDFHTTILPTMQKEVEAYKQMRMKEVEQMVSRTVMKASQEILNKSLSLNDHQQLVIEALEKAKKEGVFD